MITRIFILTLLIFITNSAMAQTQYLGWLASFNTIKTGKKTSLHSDIQLRSTDELAHIQALLLRAGLNYHPTKKIIITGGYAFIHGRRMSNGVSGYIPEHRIWEQFIYNHKLSIVNMSHRLRIEQRFIGKAMVDGDGLITDGYANANRVRYFLRNLLPLKKQDKFEKGFFAAVQNEIFLNVGNKSAVNGKTFDQNRLLLSVGYRLHSSTDLELAYVNQYVQGIGSRTNNHIAQLSVYLRL